MKRATVVRPASFSGPMVVCPSFNSRFAMTEREVGVAAALAVAVEAALHVRGAGFDGRQRIGHGQVGVVVRVDADHAVETARAPRRTISEQPPGDGAAVGVAQAQHVGAGVLRRFERPQREVADCAM